MKNKNYIKCKAIETAQQTFPVILKWLHFAFWNNESLYETSEIFLRRTKTQINLTNKDLTQNDINNFKSQKGWIIICNHECWIMSDYLPIFKLLWEEILEKCIFVNAHQVVKANSNEFKNYTFRSARSIKKDEDWNTISDYKWTKKIMNQIKEDMNNIKNNWWYIFIMPDWDLKKWEFWWYFHYLLKNSENDLPILTFNISHSNMPSYKNIVQSYVNWILSDKVQNISTIHSKLLKASDFKKDWKAISKEYEAEIYKKLF